MDEFWTQLFQLAGVGIVVVIALWLLWRRYDANVQDTVKENREFTAGVIKARDAERDERQDTQVRLEKVLTDTIRANTAVQQDLNATISGLGETLVGALSTMRETTESLFREIGVLQEQQRTLNENALSAYQRMGDALATMSERIDESGKRFAATITDVMTSHESAAQERHAQLMNELRLISVVKGARPSRLLAGETD